MSNKLFFILSAVFVIICAVICIFFSYRSTNGFTEVTAAVTSSSPAEPQQTSVSDDTAQPISDKININTATLEQLMTLDGIGKVIGQRIIDYRNENGNFDSIEDITEVSGIGEKTFENIKEQITV